MTLSEKFGHGKPLEDVFELFGIFEAGENDVIFNVSLKFNLFIMKDVKQCY